MTVEIGAIDLPQLSGGAVTTATPDTTSCASSSCGTTAQGLSPQIAAKVATHPCYSADAHRYYARMHVPVSPGCNIQCHYCNRKFDCANESRPGVTSTLLSPEQAAEKVAYVVSKVPQLSVVGVAGPGEPLANANRTLSALELVARRMPDLTLCLSTNGLTLLDHVDRIAALGVEHVTVTVNAIDPEVGARIYDWVAHRGRRYTGMDAAKVLIDRQLAGIAALTERGILCKVNSVMIPGINDGHLVEVSRTVRGLGAFLHNIMPLVSDPDHGTVFGLQGRRGPTPTELADLQAACETLDADGSPTSMNLMRHCRQCRADAIGLLGENRSAEFVAEAMEGTAHDVIPTLPLVDEQSVVSDAVAAAVNPDPAERQLERELIELLRARTRELLAGLGISDQEADRPDQVVRVAVASGNGLEVNRHLDQTEEFWVFEASGSWLRLLQIRGLDRFGRTTAETTSDDPTAAMLADCVAVLCADIGSKLPGPLSVSGPDVVYALGRIEPAVVEAAQIHLPSRTEKTV